MSLRSEVVRIIQEYFAGSKKISELDALPTPVQNSDEFEVARGGVSYKGTGSQLPSGAGGSWGSITGTLSDQTDLQTALNAKLALAGGTMAGNIAMGSNKVTGLGAASGNGEAVRYEQIVGVQDLFLSAAANWPRTTGGCGDLTKYEFATSLVNIQGLPFDATTQEFAQIQIVLPRKYNLGTITAVPYWVATSGSGSVQWGISGCAYSHDDALTAALGTAQTTDLTMTAANDLQISPATSAITLAGTPAAADLIVLQISRNPASDTLAVDAILIGVSIRVTVNSAIDA